MRKRTAQVFFKKEEKNEERKGEKNNNDTGCSFLHFGLACFPREPTICYVGPQRKQSS